MAPRKTAIILGAVIAGVFLAPLAATASLYISPAVRGTVTYHPADADRAGSDERSVRGESSVHGEFVMGAQPREDVKRFGRNVPLFVAIESLVPMADGWKANIDEGLENRSVSWDGGDDWQSVLAVIARQNSLAIVVNEDARAVGVSSSASLAPHLAKPTPQVWRMRPGKSLIENLADWASDAGWYLDSSAIDYDYAIPQGATFTGPFLQVIGEALDAFERAERPIRAQAHTGNRVIQLLSGGYKQEVTR
ncbi:hypothetical protein J2T57_001371 [Natronocella acetinitrilica]|uniref:Toxin co-regulated pilus biosynthesis protein Q C-terminal domain-containing protein n=1 Tax=Natronocella acetinitrilica TaxID=414046 RepID=A0AAE3KB20_9GAMM|nr:TcpQ domain-containing protein [Natronocella acetinitrilica]MCP1674269.1 hypothetical protein [Natronocella acetinitrilica]